MKIDVTNKGLRFHPADASEEAALSDFKEDTAYWVEGARHSRAYRTGMWDGKERLVKRDRGRWSAPVGLLFEAFESFGECEVNDNRVKPGKSLAMHLDPEVIPKLRDYQDEACEAILEDRGVLTGKGLLRLPTRSGKTVIAGEAACRLGYRMLFVVNSDMLLRQTLEFFRKAIVFDEEPHEGLSKVGQFGGGEADIGWITVASVQSITRRLKSKPVVRLLREVDVVFFDECHHLTGALWRKAMTSADAWVKVGLSATIKVDRHGSTARGAIWLVGATGPVLYSLEPSDLIEAGWLCRPIITFLTAPDLPWEINPAGSYHEKYRAGIAENEGRNALVAKIAREEVDKGNRVLVTVRLLDHVKLLQGHLERAGLRCAVVTGKTAGAKRQAYTEQVKLRELDVLLGTVFGESVDLPFLECVIVADGAASEILVMQRLRNLTPVDENDRALIEPMLVATEVPVYDFADFTCKTLQHHSLQRLRTYKTHRAFRILWRDE